MKFFVFLCIVVTAAGFKLPGVALPKETRDSSERIIEGWPASTGQFPHQAYLSIGNGDGYGFICGGALISTRWVVTSAYCLYRWTQADVYLGNIHYPSSSVKITTRQLFVHPNFVLSNFNNDIGLIDLQQDVKVTADIQPIRIENQISNSYAGRIALLSGFGSTSNSGPAGTTLNFVNMTVITNKECTDIYGDRVILNSTICAYGLRTGAEGACNGDSGAPLVLQDVKPDILVGIATFSAYGICDAKYPSGFTRPNSFIPWMSEITGIAFT